MPERIEVNGVTLSVTDTGDGPPVVLLHGFPDRAELWRHQIPALVAAGHRVIAPDLRGFGDSDAPDGVEAYRIRTLVGDVVGLLDTLGIERAAVVGHDWGAGLAWAVAMFAPDRVARLTALSVGHAGTRAAAGREQNQLSWYMLWFLFPGVAERVMPADDWEFLRQWGWGGQAHPDLERQIADLSRPGRLTAALNWYRANIDPATFVARDGDGLPSVRCPTLGVWSDADPFLGETQMRASEHFVDAEWRYVRLDGVDHWIPVRAPERLAELLVDWNA